MKKRHPKTEGVLEKSCGAVLYKLIGGEPYYALVRGGAFGFPKGHVEKGESEMQTAMREVREETGVIAAFDAAFRREVIYRSPRFRTGKKRVVFFLAECPEDQTPAPHHETKELLLIPYEEAMSALKLDTLKRVLSDANEKITKAHK